MNPPLSMIVFTLLAGTGQGLLLALCGIDLAAKMGAVDAPARGFFVIGAVWVVLCAALGLAAATFHLGHPLRAWRALAMWRTSWLSREVIVLPAFMAAVALWGARHAAGADPLPAAAVACVLALALYLCTGMIYAAITVIREWATPLTPLQFALTGIASGLVAALVLAAFLAPWLREALLPVAVVAIVAAAAVRAATAVRNRRLVPRTTLQSAIGVRHPQIRQTAQGAMGGSFNTREFFHGRRPSFLIGARWSAAVLGFVVPVLGIGRADRWGILAVLVVQVAGLAAERWLFFADARHPQNLYYQAIA
jgi:sulfite dehydrogenase (quinone) subunit SoeC